MGIDIVDKSFYLTSIFANIKSDHKWTTNETKMVLLLFKELSKYKIFLPDLEGFDDTIKELQERIKNVPVTYEFNRKDFQAITGVRQEHASREIKKVAKGLLSKVIVTPHPLKPDDINSFKAFTWFTDIEYISTTGIIKLKVNDSAIERLVAFVKYSHINFEHVIKIQNHNAIHTYLTLKILLDSSRTNTVTITINEYKQRLGLDKKYRNLSEFRKYVLEVIEKEVNEYTDLNLSYELIKEGRSYTKIRFNFDYKDVYIMADDKQRASIDNKTNSQAFEYSTDEECSVFEAQLASWGIRARTIVEWEEKYSLDAIFKSIEITKQAILDDTINGSIAGYFKGVLENIEFESQKEFENMKLQAIRDQEEAARKAKLLKIESDYNSMQKDIDLYQDELAKYLTAKSMGASIDISSNVSNFIKKISNIDIEQFKGYKSEFAALEIGYFDYNKSDKLRPNMYDFLTMIVS